VGAPPIDVTTGLGFPKKAHDARANPLVALLFSDPTGSGLEDPPMVLIQGSADVDDRDLEANRDRYARESIQKLSATAKLHPPDVAKRFFGRYYTRIYIHIRPERIFVCGRKTTAPRNPSSTTRIWKRSGPGTRKSPRGSTPCRPAARAAGIRG
jgi:hypothetical protein